MKALFKQFIKILLFFFLLSFFSFIIVKLAPGDPVMTMLRVDDIAASKQDIDNLREELGLNKPIIVQYGIWLNKAVRFDFGNSVITGNAVVSEITKALPATIILTSTSLLAMMLIAVPLGIGSALYRNSLIDKIGQVFNLIGSSIPAFWLGYILVDIFAIRLKLLPSMGTGGLEHLILPSLTLGIAMAPSYVKLLKTSLIDSMGQDFVRSAKARGIYGSRIFFFHVLRNSLIPIITVFGLTIGSLLGGTVIIEVVFSYSGLGKLAIDAIIKRDYAVIQGFILLIGSFVFILNLIVDILYKFIDPSIAIRGGEYEV